MPTNLTRLNTQNPTPGEAGPTWASQLASTLAAADRTVMVNVKNFGALGDNSTNDTSAIQAAIAAVAAQGGGAVFFPAGNYLTTNLTITSNNTWLVGESQGSILKAHASTSVANLISWSLTQGGGARNLAISGNAIVNSGYALIGINKGLRLTVDGCQISNWNDGNGIRITESSHCSIQNNHIYGGATANSGIVVCLSTNDIYTQPASYNRIVNNHIEETQGTLGNSIRISSSCTTTRPYKQGFVIGNLVANNTSVRAGAAGIEVSFGCNKTRVIGNHIERPATSGILTREAVATMIEGNFLSQCPLYGISVGLRSALIANTDGSDFHTSVIGNCVDTSVSSDGIVCREVTGSLVVSGNLSFAHGVSNPGSGFAGITVEECPDGAVITGNCCQGNTDHGIKVAGSSNATVTGNVCTGNAIAGIAVISAVAVMVANNNCHSNQYGVRVTGSTSTQGRVVHNDLSGNSTSGLSWDGASADFGVSENIGFVSEAAGSSSMAAGGTARTITHGLNTGLGAVPDQTWITVTPLAQATNDIGQISVDTVTSTTFIVRFRNAPGGTGISFAWQIHPPI